MRSLDRLKLALGSVRIQPFRMEIKAHEPVDGVTISMLRGVWGSALHVLNEALYSRIFEGRNGGNAKIPAYIIRPAAGTTETCFCIEWILFGAGVDASPALFEVWNRAGSMGLGKR
jgi:hypothetical protein